AELWPATSRQSNEVQEMRRLLELCAQLEDTPADFEHERQKCDLIRRIGRSVRKLPSGSWAAVLAVQVLVSQLSVRLSTVWTPTEEALLYVSSELTPAEEAPAGSLATAGGRKKKRRKKAAAAAGDEPNVAAAAAVGCDESEAEAEDNEDAPLDGAGKKRPRAQAKVAEPPEAKAPARKRRKPTGVALAEEDDGALGLHDDIDELDLEPWLKPGVSQHSEPSDWEEVPAGWWWGEAIWFAAVRIIEAHEAAPRKADAGDDDDEQKQRPVMAQRLKRRDGFQLNTEGLQEGGQSALWKGGAQCWRAALEEVWRDLDNFQPWCVAGVTMHDLAWRLVTKLLGQNVWRARSGGLSSWQVSLGRQHNEWLLAKLLQHMRGRYGEGFGGSSNRVAGQRVAMVHALQCVAAMPTIEVCDKSLVKLCVHGCLHWLLQETDMKIQHLALAIMARCRRSFPFMAACEASLKRLCDDTTFNRELLSLSVTQAGEETPSEGKEAADGNGGGGNVLYDHREALMPVVLRILFSKATKKGRQLDKRTTQTSRRGSVFSYLSALTEEAGMPELLLVLLESMMLVLAPAPDPETEASATKFVAVSSSIRRAAILRRVFAQRAEGLSGAASAEWWGKSGGELLSEKGKLSGKWGRGEQPQQAEEPLGWSWPVGPSSSSSSSASGACAVVLSPLVSPQRLLGFLQSLADVIPQMASKLQSHAVFLMEIIATLIERVGVATRSLQRHEQAQVTRQILRAALLRARDLMDRFLELVPELMAALRPAAGTLEFLFARLAKTSGAVQTSAIALLAQSWAKEPALFCCFQELCPGALPSLFLGFA
ncbi:unnamed protein product, partial [Polarella glacialis]